LWVGNDVSIGNSPDIGGVFKARNLYLAFRSYSGDKSYGYCDFGDMNSAYNAVTN
jgi:hypothetical protein